MGTHYESILQLCMFSGAKRVRAPRRAHIHCKSILQLCMFQAPKEYVHRVGHISTVNQCFNYVCFRRQKSTCTASGAPRGSASSAKRFSSSSHQRRPLSTSSAAPVYLGCISAVSRVYLGCISAVSRGYLGCISGISRRSHEHISTSPVRLVPRGGRHGSCSTPLRVTAKSTLPRWSVA